MSDLSYPPFLKWGNYKSEDSAKPDKLAIEITEVDTFETQYGVNVNAIVDGVEMAVSLHSFNSTNTMLLKLWSDNVKKGVKFTLLTWLGVSRNDRKIRKWKMEFNS